MDWLPLYLVFGAMGVGLILETLLLIGMMGLLETMNRKFNLLLSNYKADLEMVLLYSHNMDEFIKKTQEFMAAVNPPPGMVDPDETVYIR